MIQKFVWEHLYFVVLQDHLGRLFMFNVYCSLNNKLKKNITFVNYFLTIFSKTFIMKIICKICGFIMIFAYVINLECTSIFLGTNIHYDASWLLVTKSL